MSTIEFLFIFAVAMSLGAIIAFAFMFRILLRSEKELELKKAAMEVVLRDMYGHDVESLNKAVVTLN